ncbi:putative Zn(II)2Cys6 transcription factor [Aspergillus egyptiacus]|nr:putative Zn(II)2Cys6 transcription factor [Aspergillus egyptiacus]
MPDVTPHGGSVPLQNDADQPHATRPRKRKRVSVACRSCRTRKSRCNGRQPCSSCEDMETECRYDEPPSRPVPTTGSATSALTDTNSLLERRLQMIEERLHVLDSDRRFAGADKSTSPATRDDHHARTSVGRDSPLDRNDGVDGMGAIPLNSGAGEEEYFGESSNVSFLRFIIDSVRPPAETVLNPCCSNVGQPTGIPSDGAMDTALGNPMTARSPLEGRQTSQRRSFTLPPKEEANALLALYFNTVNLMIPCIDEDSFRETYRQMQVDGLASVRRSWLGILSVIFALAINVTAPTSPTPELATRSQTYFTQALELMRPYILGRSSLEMLQLFLLMETYSEGTPSASLTWTFHGLAVKGAYQLGLHVVGLKGESELDREIRARLWYWCVMNDRLLSVRYGRPPLIPLSHVRLGADLQMPFSNVSRPTTQASLGSITHIMGETVDRLYEGNLGFPTSSPTSEVLNRVSSLCWKLAQWQDRLPPYLQIINCDSETRDEDHLVISQGTLRFRVLLSLRYLGARVLILRPVLTNFFLDPSGILAPGEHQSRWLRKSGAGLLEDLVHTCHAVFQISKKILVGTRSDQNLLGAWWFLCYYAFNASLAIVGVLLVARNPTYSGELPTVSAMELRSMLGTAMEILYGLDQGNNTMIMKCRDTLQRILRAIDNNNGIYRNVSGFTPLSVSSPSEPTWRLVDPGLFSSEASLSLAMGPPGAEWAAQIPAPPETWDIS